MQKQTRSILEELNNVSFAKDKENVVESRASHILDSAIRLLTYIGVSEEFKYFAILLFES